MPAHVTNFEAATVPFAGQGDLFIFDSLADDAAYAEATIQSLANPKSLGQIVQDSTSWDGDDAEVSQIKDEQGDIITARVVAGSLAFSFEAASTSQEMVQKFLKGHSISSTFTTGDLFPESAKVTGFGTELPVFTAPIAIANDELNRVWLYPKAKIISNLSYSDGLWRIKASVIAQYINTEHLATGMIIEGAVNYNAE